MSEEKLIVFTADEVAIYLRTSLRTVRRLVREGHIKGAKVGRTYRVTKAALEAYLQGEGSESEHES